jgi:hypothetical protein
MTENTISDLIVSCLFCYSTTKWHDSGPSGTSKVWTSELLSHTLTSSKIYETVLYWITFHNLTSTKNETIDWGVRTTRWYQSDSFHNSKSRDNISQIRSTTRPPTVVQHRALYPQVDLAKISPNPHSHTDTQCTTSWVQVWHLIFSRHTWRQVRSGVVRPQVTRRSWRSCGKYDSLKICLIHFKFCVPSSPQPIENWVCQRISLLQFLFIMNRESES